MYFQLLPRRCVCGNSDNNVTSSVTVMPASRRVVRAGRNHELAFISGRPHLDLGGCFAKMKPSLSCPRRLAVGGVVHLERERRAGLDQHAVPGSKRTASSPAPTRDARADALRPREQALPLPRAASALGQPVARGMPMPAAN